jgi:hypothetical protein
MIDLNVELGALIDELQRADVEFALTGSLADSLHRGSGIQRSIDLMVWPEDRPSAEGAADRLGFLQMGSLKGAQAGRYHLRRLIKTDEADILRVNLAAPASLVTATGLGACVTISWRERRVKVTGRASLEALERDSPRPAGRLTLDVLQLFWPDHETWSERDLLPRFDALVAVPETATSADVEALLVGLSCRCPLRWPWQQIVHTLGALPSGLAEQSPALGAYVRAVRAGCGPGRGVRCYFRNTSTGLQWA